MIVGAVINKPIQPTSAAQSAPSAPAPAMTSVPQAVPAMSPQQPSPVPCATQPMAGIMQAQLPPGMIAVNHSLLPASVSVNNGSAAQTNGDSISAAVSATSQSPLLNYDMANTKEKTPMCLINELARFNKIQHQYTLTDEQGPAHKKTFYVKLKLGEEEYAASGPSIKKAQHAAAQIALEQTRYKHPPPKPPKSEDGVNWDSGEFLDSITPTVELNALAMKRGEPAVYRPMEMQRPQYFPPPNLDFRGMFNQRSVQRPYHYPRGPAIFYVSLKVGQREFIGEGRTRQAARHSAADKALKVLRNLPLPTGGKRSSSPDQDAPQPQAGVPVQAVVEASVVAPAPPTPDNSADALKSEISLVHEIALKRNMNVSFEVTRESGPPHMRTFVTRATCGELACEAEGNSKKVSKKRAAEKMLDELRELPGLPSATNKPKKNPGNKKKNRNLIKVEKATPDYGVGINPISRLIQIQQAKKEKEPMYTLVAERGLPRRREFVMQVTVGEHTCNGAGPNKKLAKRNAAEAMLQLLGYSRPAPQPSKPAIKSEPGMGVNNDKKVTFMDSDSHPQTRQLVPGVILMPEAQRAQMVAGGYLGQGGSMNRAPGGPMTPLDIGVKYSNQTTAAIAKELLDTGASPTAESISKAANCTPMPVTQVASVPVQSVVRPKKQLLYLADVLGFQVEFQDFPKGNNKNQYLSLVSLSTNPPQVSHGAGQTIESSHDMAALTALKSLSALGLDTVTAGHMDNMDSMAAGDGPHVCDDQKLASSIGDHKAEVK